MSLAVIDNGLMDTLQDKGRVGYANLGINRNGPMDWHAAAMCNALLGNSDDAAVIEMFFPAASFRVLSDCVVALSGADFCCCVNQKAVGSNRVLHLKKNDSLVFSKKIHGEIVYLGIGSGFKGKSILGSIATNLQAGFGGINGKRLQPGDVLGANTTFKQPYKRPNLTYRNSWNPILIGVLPGAEWNFFSTSQRNEVLSSNWQKTTEFNRMGCVLASPTGMIFKAKEMISSPVEMGTIQYLPSGKLIVLCADHQTTGGYPRLFQVAKAYLPAFVQMKPNTSFQLKLMSIDEAIAQLAKLERQIDNMYLVNQSR